MEVNGPALGVKFKRVAVHQQHCTLGPVPAGELNQLARAGAIFDCLCISIASRCLTPPLARDCHHRDCRRRQTRTGTGTGTGMGTGTGTGIAIGVVVIVVSIHTAATTDTVLPTADSATAVRACCHPCHVEALSAA